MKLKHSMSLEIGHIFQYSHIQFLTVCFAPVIVLNYSGSQSNPIIYNLLEENLLDITKFTFCVLKILTIDVEKK